MEKKSNLSNAKSNMENIKSNGPSADDLKRRFKEGNIPLQTDYADLINIADIGRRAVSKAPGQTDNPNSALKLDNDGALAVKLSDNGGLKADENGLSVKIKNKSLLADNNGLAVNAGRGLRINNDKLEVNNHHGIEIVNEGVKVKASNGINVDNSGVSVKTGNGINVDTHGVSIKAKDETINVESTGISVKLGWGVREGGLGLDVKPSDGINVDGNGVSVKAGNGITVNSSGVSINPNKVLPRGMIVMFSGDIAPTGWAFCDGSNGTPDLKNRFVMCGNNFSDKGKSPDPANSNSSGKDFFRNTTPTEVSVSVNVQNTALTIEQIPKHSHIGGAAFDDSSTGVIGYGSYTYQTIDSHGTVKTGPYSACLSQSVNNIITYTYYYPRTSDTGNGQGHNHQATASSSSHDHRVNVIPPYYLLAFIMKL
ncbi:tail fiber protein [Photorhabdus laumondii]|uniref:tail fiber protein n=1 Tax=Photorhabdus laumondii TaxID=2218628 RepID=UPI0033159E82